MLNLDDDIVLATNMRKRAYADTSNYTVGAVLQTKNGKDIQGAI